ncbi:beta/gamma crystallin domain-containing protein [Nitrosospira sp. Nsp1]|uniref:beta/gamma crystallin domain-containing protein n=1 Tax=Nitrosospira sp. Nsp1 TaxID=136547 RepID=UPI000881C741|nr:beta/gamma crystallin domain-containing protein [Nitrosospira sp. Nsp1]SCX59343.1 Beta/Gamma crystallin [Nitrosospira sp. Nsp1]
MNILIKNPRNLLVAIAAVFGLYAGSGVYAQDSIDKSNASEKSKHAEKSKKNSQTKKNEGGTIVEVPVLMMVPVEVSSDMSTNSGCWVKLYDKKDYSGDSFLLVGPVELPVMTGPFGFNWENKVRSLEVGPNANLTIFDNRNFRDQDKFVDAGKKVPNMSKKMGFFDDFRSMMLTCI